MKKIIMLLALAFLLIFTASCGNPSDTAVETPVEGSGSTEETQEVESEKIIYAPDFELMDLDGNIVTLSDLKGKNLIINFWATWCPYCIEEMPDLQKLHDKYKDGDFMVLAVNVREKGSKARSYLEENNIEIPVLLDIEGTASYEYGANSIPLSVAVNKNGIIVTGKLGMMTYDEMESMYKFILANQ
ncbi:Peroxiredoxin [Dethiosulfatibacter aminovorans DSM 17477]|uniref:Peroxiredoxin n=1 Tax=Dethiosulfatibacter aminovorans DSM 17477 TaxID=1121476 RepID=A0A1M6IPZ7_9FIRM|nr:TlpA family protein disulfide reductase [Dethiosulfatibacter aminovorans]SHJ36419.1 Peroxiredoxin [Dethiosulfatibacter aminovorans DSM 17477]